MTHDRQRQRQPGNRIPVATPPVPDHARPSEELPVDETREAALRAFERIRATREKAARKDD